MHVVTLNTAGEMSYLANDGQFYISPNKAKPFRKKRAAQAALDNLPAHFQKMGDLKILLKN